MSSTATIFFFRLHLYCIQTSHFLALKLIEHIVFSLPTINFIMLQFQESGVGITQQDNRISVNTYIATLHLKTSNLGPYVVRLRPLKPLYPVDFWLIANIASSDHLVAVPRGDPLNLRTSIGFSDIDPRDRCWSQNLI